MIWSRPPRASRDMLRSAATLSSTIVTDRLRLLQRQVAPLRTASLYLADLGDRITEHLIRSARDHRTDTLLTGGVTSRRPWRPGSVAAVNASAFHAGMDNH
ncbi:MAG: hypothetical protein ACRDTC_22140 [Pseudonocardiaceae bacterium]